MATRTSCRSVRRGWCAWTSPVATVSTPRCSARVAEKAEPPRISPLERPLQLDVEALSAERAGETTCRVGVEEPEAAPRAPRQADEPLVRLRNGLERDGRRQRLTILAAGAPCTRMRSRQQAAEIRVAAARLDEQCDVRAALDRDLGARERPHAERLRGVCELERPVDAVVVGERERLISELGCASGELFRLRRPVQEGVRRMRMEFDVPGHD
jgi:hypothetical protein